MNSQILKSGLIFIMLCLMAGSVHHQKLDAASPTPQPSLTAQIFFDGFSENCELPCWNELQPGHSNYQHLYTTLKNFDFEDFSEGVDNKSNAETRHEYIWTREFSNYFEYTSAEGYTFPNEFSIMGYTHNDRLVGLQFITDGYFLLDIAPQRIFETFGVPSNIWFGFYFYDNPVYVSGIVMFEYEHLSTYFHYEFDVSRLDQQFCFSPEKWLEDARPAMLRFYIIDTSSPYMKNLVMPYMIHARKTLDELTDFTSESFVEFVLAEDNPCIEVDIQEIESIFE